MKKCERGIQIHVSMAESPKSNDGENTLDNVFKILVKILP